MTREEVRLVLAAWDGTSVAPLRNLMSVEPSILLAELPGPNEVASTWILKAQAEAGQTTVDVFEKFAELTAADAILHVLQMVQHAPEAATILRDQLVPHNRHPRILVRVWAFDAYIRTTPKGQEQDRDARIAQALTDRSKAMQARGRALQKLYRL